jgi:hypothetical protein
MNFAEWWDTYQVPEETLYIDDMRLAFEAGQASAIAENKAEYNLGVKETAQAVVKMLTDTSNTEQQFSGVAAMSWTICCKIQAESISDRFGLRNLENEIDP